MKISKLFIPILIILFGSCEKDRLNNTAPRTVEILNLNEENEQIVPPFYLKYKSEDAEFFNIYLDTTIQFNNCLYSNITMDSVLLDSLEYNKSYFVKVGAVYVDGDTVYSEKLQFKTATNFGENIFPDNQKENVPINTVLKYFHPLANSYDVYILEPLEQIVRNRKESELALEGLQYNQSYMWKVQAICDNDKIIESDIFEFRTTDGFDINRYPQNNSKDLDINVKLSFNHPLAMTYTVYWGNSTNKQNIYNTTENSLNLNDLKLNTQYFWSVVAIGENKLFRSETFSFTTIEDFSKEIFPLDNSAYQETDLKLSFYHPLAKTYTIFLDTEEVPTKQISTNQIKNWESIIDLENNTRYYWRVIANCDSNKTATSKIYSFKTKGNCKFEGFSKMSFDMPKYILKAVKKARGSGYDTIQVTSDLGSTYKEDGYYSFCQDGITVFEIDDESLGKLSGWFNVDTVTETLDVSFRNSVSQKNDYGDHRYGSSKIIQFSGLKYNIDEEAIKVHLPNSEIVNYIDTVGYRSSSTYISPYDGIFTTVKESFELIEISDDKDLKIEITYK